MCDHFKNVEVIVSATGQVFGLGGGANIWVMTDRYLLFQTMNGLSAQNAADFSHSYKERWGCREGGEWNVNSVNHSL